MNNEIGPIEQLRVALRNPSALLVGALLGAFVPVATSFEAHLLLRRAASWNVEWAMVLAGLAYSGKTVWQWGCLTFGDKVKATGFVVLLEGVMVISPLGWLANVALAYLVAINAIATGCLLAMRDRTDKEQRVADGSERCLGNGAAPTELPAAPYPLLRQEEPAAYDHVPLEDGEGDDHENALYKRAVQHVLLAGTCTTSALQRELKVGYPRASKLVDRMAREGLIGPPAKAAGRPVVSAVQTTVLT